jgi:hypothetical protein
MFFLKTAEKSLLPAQTVHIHPRSANNQVKNSIMAPVSANIFREVPSPLFLRH